MRKKIKILLTAAIMFCITNGSCTNENGKRGEEIAYQPTETQKYENCMEIDGQWGSSAATGKDGEYGIGDPFVMRYNGKYYLYPSTSDPCDGVKVFESDDLVHWTYRGFAVAENQFTAHGAYAPEVTYYNGYFYMCQSRGGNGHYIYRSQSPTEGFVLYSQSDEGTTEDINYGNIGLGIDGSFYTSDDGELYLLHTSTPAGLKYNRFTDMDNIRASSMGATGTLGDANLRHWIEGPGIFRRGEYSYLTYTGNHVISKGYRIAYSYAKNLSDLSSFIQPVDNVTLMDTDENHYGLGHGSNVNGPDLDSVYTAYHSLVGNGPARRYNLDRYLSFGSVLTANGVTHREVSVPSAPTAKAEDGDCLFYRDGAYWVGESSGYFTAEYNLIPTEGQQLFFGINEGGRYAVRFTDGGLSLFEKTGATEKKIAENTATYAAGRIATVRVENGDGIGYVYLNGMRVLSYTAKKAAGGIGCASKEMVEYSAFTNDVFGTSDFEAVKNLPTKFPAVAYLKGENRGFSILEAKEEKGGVRVGEKQSVVSVGDAYAAALKKDDWVKYAVDVPKDGVYSLAAQISRKSCATVEITIGDGSLTATIPAAGEGESDTVKVSLGRLAAKAGVTTMKVRVVSGEAEFVSFETYEDAEEPNSAELSDWTVYRGNAVFTDGVWEVTGVDTHSVALWGNAGVADFETEITFTCSAEARTNFGFMIRASNYSYFPAQPAQSWRGYYLRLSSQMMTLSRYDYGEEVMTAIRTGEISLSDGKPHTLKIRAESGWITATLDGVCSFRARDDCAFLSGKLGAFSSAGTLRLLGFTYRIL